MRCCALLAVLTCSWNYCHESPEPGFLGSGKNYPFSIICLIQVRNFVAFHKTTGVNLFLVEILNLNICQAQDIEDAVLSRFWKQVFGQDFEAEFWSRFWSWSFVEILRLNLGRDFEAEFDQYFEAQVWT